MVVVLSRRQMLAGICLGVLGPLAGAQDFGRPLTLPASAGGVPPATAGAPGGSLRRVAERWQLRKGALVHEELRVWAQLAGWEFRWHPAMTWSVVADTAFPGEFADAISRVIEALHREGQPVRLVLWEGNKVAEVVSNDVR